MALEENKSCHEPTLDHIAYCILHIAGLKKNLFGTSVCLKIKFKRILENLFSFYLQCATIKGIFGKLQKLCVRTIYGAVQVDANSRKFIFIFICSVPLSRRFLANYKNFIWGWSSVQVDAHPKGNLAACCFGNVGSTLAMSPMWGLGRYAGCGGSWDT